MEYEVARFTLTDACTNHKIPPCFYHILMVNFLFMMQKFALVIIN